MEKTESDWSIEALYRGAWQIVKHNPVLWLFGMAAAIAGSGYNFRFPDVDPQGWQKIFEDAYQQGGNDAVLGNATSALFESVSQLFAHVPVWLYVAIGIELLIFLAITIVLALIYSNWANASLLSGIQLAMQKKPVSIADSSERALSKIIPLLQTTFVPSLLLSVIMLVVIGMLAMGIAISPSGLKAIFILFLIVWIAVLIVAWFLLSLTLIWASREVVVHNKKPREALGHGYHLAKKKFWSMLLLGFVNNIVTTMAIAIPVGLMIGALVGGFFAFSSYKSLGISLFVFGGTLLFLFLLAGWVIAGVITAFKAAVWSLALEAIKDL